jgi:hypothetical protein
MPKSFTSFIIVSFNGVILLGVSSRWLQPLNGISLAAFAAVKYIHLLCFSALSDFFRYKLRFKVVIGPALRAFENEVEITAASFTVNEQLLVFFLQKQQTIFLCKFILSMSI